jgi:hypothetical protein
MFVFLYVTLASQYRYDVVMDAVVNKRVNKKMRDTEQAARF